MEALREMSSSDRGESHPTLAIVILNYRTASLVEDCLAALAPQMAQRTDRQVIVVDNASGDGSIDAIQQAIADHDWSAWAKAVEARHNRGFAAGNNLGVQQAPEADYVLLFNSDTLARAGALDAMVQRMEREPTIGMLGPRLEWPNATPQISAFRFRNPGSELIAAARTGPVTRWLSRYDVVAPIPSTLSEREWVSYAAVMLRRRMLEDVGMLDSGYFMYFEDIDHCRRAKAKGWRVVYDPEPRVVHLRGGSSSVKSSAAARARRPRYYYESRSRYFRKFYGRPGLWATNMLWHLGRGVSKTRELLGRPCTVCVAEWRDIWIHALKPRPARHEAAPVSEPAADIEEGSTAKTHRASEAL